MLVGWRLKVVEKGRIWHLGRLRWAEGVMKGRGMCVHENELDKTFLKSLR